MARGSWGGLWVSVASVRGKRSQSTGRSSTKPAWGYEDSHLHDKERGLDRCSLHNNPTLRTPAPWTSGLENWEKRSSSCLHCPVSDLTSSDTLMSVFLESPARARCSLEMKNLAGVKHHFWGGPLKGSHSLTGDSPSSGFKLASSWSCYTSKHVCPHFENIFIYFLFFKTYSFCQIYYSINMLV